MKTVRVRFLEKGEETRLPKGMKILPKPWQKAYIEKRRPYHLDGDTAVLQTTAENSPHFREQAEKLLEKLKRDGVELIIPPIAGELPGNILPFADGRRLTNLFAFEGAAEALRRQGKSPGECRYLLVGGNEDAWRAALTSMDNEVNHLAIFTLDPDSAKELTQELFEERGLMTEVFSSPKNQAFRQADVVFCCGMEQRAYEHMLGKGAAWVDLVGNRPVLRRLREKREDVFVADGFFFKKDDMQAEGRFAEAEAFLTCPIFRGNFQFSLEKAARNEMLCELQEKGYAVSGFSVLGKRVKIVKKP